MTADIWNDVILILGFLVAVGIAYLAFKSDRRTPEQKKEDRKEANIW